MLLFVAPLCVAGQATPPRRIVSASPSTTEILYGIGAFARVVAVSDYCTYPPAVQRLPRIGGWENPNMERLLSLAPDLVIVTEAQAPLVEDRLKQLNLRTLIVPGRTLEDAFTAMKLIGRAVGEEAGAAELSRKTREALNALRARTAARPARTVLLVVDRTPGTLRELYAATTGSFLAELIEIAGGKSAATPIHAGYGKLSKEAILTLNPELIIDVVHSPQSRFGENADEVWRDLPELRAVRERHVYSIRDEFLPHCSQFVVNTVERFARIIHPELFTNQKRAAR